MALTTEQQQFLNHPTGKSARLLAGPGTGKSFTSVAYLKKVTEENPELRVGYITFTRAATAEFAKKIDEGGLTVMPKTMHGFSLGVLIDTKSSNIPYPLRLLDSWETKYISRPDITAMLRAKGFNQITPSFVGKLERELAAGFESLEDTQLPIAAESPELVNAYKGAWRYHRHAYGYVLLNELSYHAAKVLEDMDDITLPLDLLIVDEYQDLNNAEQKVLLEIAKRNVPILAIGDDDQSIYSWRNAAPDGIRRFLSNFGTEYDYPLSISMRCGGKALEVASNLIELDSGRPSKTRLTTLPESNDTAFHYLKFRSNIGEAKGVARIIKSRINSGVPAEDIGIIVRSSIPAWLHNLKKAFEEEDIKIAQSIDISEILGDFGTRKATSMAQLHLNRLDAVSWRALLKITPGIGAKFVNQIEQSEHAGNFADKLMKCYADGFAPGAGSTQATELVGEVLAWLGTVTTDDIRHTDNGWGDWMIDQVGVDKFKQEELTILRAVGAMVGISEPLSRFLVDLEPLAKEIVSGSNIGVRIMNMSSSKGLTLNTVIVMGVENGNVPAPRGDINEELRLLFVALTRATDMTIVTYSSIRRGPTAFVGNPRQTIQREQSQFMHDLTGIRVEDGDSFGIA